MENLQSSKTSSTNWRNSAYFSVNVSDGYRNPSFLVKKPNGGHRLITALSNVGRYSRPQPSLLPDIDLTLMLAVTTAALYTRIRSRGLSAREMWSQCDQFSNTQVCHNDEIFIQTQNEQRLTIKPHSEKSKAPLAQRRPTPSTEVGDIVYLHSNRNKSRTKERYIVFAVGPPFCNMRKFTGTQLHSAFNCVKLSECLKVPSDISTNPPYPANDSEAEDDLILAPLPPPPPDIPAAISMPVLNQDPNSNQPCKIPVLHLQIRAVVDH